MVQLDFSVLILVHRNALLAREMDLVENFMYEIE